MNRRAPARPPAAYSSLDGLLLAAAAVLAAGAGWFWLVSGLSAWATAGHWPTLPWHRLAAAVGHLPAHPTDPAGAWASAGRAPGDPVRGALFYLISAATVLVGAVAVRRLRPAARSRPDPARWARGTDLRALTVRRAGRGSRVVIGRTATGRRLVATEARHSLLVIGPTQSGKTTGLAIPAILEWPGPIVATSVKDDLATRTLAWRSSLGPVAVFDPTLSSGLTVRPGPGLRGPRSRWSPLSACESWSAAQKMAAWLVESTPGRQGMADAAFWYTSAGKQLAPLLLAAHRSGMTMSDVVRWTNTEDFNEPLRLLQLSGDDPAAISLGACAGRDERIRSSIGTTLETVLAPFEDPTVGVSTSTTDVDLAALLAGNGTLYLCGPTHEQHRVQGLFSALVSTVISTAISITSESGRSLEPPLLLVLDEAANIAPIRDLDTLAATGAGLGIQLVTVCQDLAQLAARYDPDRARTIANNHRAKLLLSGVSDVGTLDLVSGLAGEQAVREESTTHDLRSGGRTRSVSTELRRLAPTDELRRVPPGEGVLVYGHLAPVRLRLRPWYRDRALRRRADPGYDSAGSGGLRARLGATRGGSPGIFG